MDESAAPLSSASSSAAGRAHFFLGGAFGWLRFGPGPAPSVREYRPDIGAAEVCFTFPREGPFDVPPDPLRCCPLIDNSGN